MILIAARAQDAYDDLAEQLRASGAVPCRTATDPEAWWTQRETDTARTQTAVAACPRCRVRTACLDYALAAGEEHGVWGATTPTDRRELLSANISRRAS